MPHRGGRVPPDELLFRDGERRHMVQWIYSVEQDGNPVRRIEITAAPSVTVPLTGE